MNIESDAKEFPVAHAVDDVADEVVVVGVPVEVVAVEPPVKVMIDPGVVEPPIEELVDPVMVEPFVIALAVAMVGLMFREAVFEVPPPTGVTTVTCTVPGSAMSVASTVAVSCVGDT